jgi:hypothetical protein
VTSGTNVPTFQNTLMMGASRSSPTSAHFDPYTGHRIFIFIYLFICVFIYLQPTRKRFQSLILHSAAMVGLLMNNELNPSGSGCRKIRGTLPGIQDSPRSIHLFFFCFPFLRVPCVSYSRILTSHPAFSLCTQTMATAFLQVLRTRSFL